MNTTQPKTEAMDMITFCSVSLVDYRINNTVRRSAAAKATVVKEADIMPCSEKTVLCEDYEIYCPDPLENPGLDSMFVDVEVNIVKSGGKDEKVAKALKELGPFETGPRRRFITREENQAPVSVEPWRESPVLFYRRLSLYDLATLIRDSYKEDRRAIFDELFEDPEEMTENSDLMSLTNRSKFSKESLEDWFFDLDTYSKCITLVEVFSRKLYESMASVRIDMYDLYCRRFSGIKRQVSIALLDDSDFDTRLKNLSPLPDVRLVSASKVISDFLSFTTSTVTKRLSMITADRGDDEAPSVKKLRVTDGYESFSISPFEVEIRTRPKVGISQFFNQLLFPVYAEDKEILFLMKIRPHMVATLFLPGLFRSREQYYSGLCRGLTSNNGGRQWRFTLADYSPVRGDKCCHRCHPQWKMLDSSNSTGYTESSRPKKLAQRP